MTKYYYLILIALFLSVTIANGNSPKEAHDALHKWFNGRNFAREKVTKLHFYVEDILSGPNQSNIPVAAANSTATSPTFFGLIAVIDNPIRKEPSPNSEILGRAQGFFAFASLEQFKIHMTFDLVFTSGAYNGSVLNVVGHNPYMTSNREMAVVGGSGVFRLARGVVLVSTASTSATGAFFDFNVIVLHYG